MENDEKAGETKQIAEYIAGAFKNPKVKKLFDEIIKSPLDFSRLSSIILAYAIATRDLSAKGLEDLCKPLREISNTSAATRDWEPIFSAAVREKIGGNEQKPQEILDTLVKNCAENGFFTHSFPGTHLKSVREKGLLANSTEKLYFTVPSTSTFFYSLPQNDEVAVTDTNCVAIFRRDVNRGEKADFVRMAESERDSNADLDTKICKIALPGNLICVHKQNIERKDFEIAEIPSPQKLKSMKYKPLRDQRTREQRGE
jgi:hypothetical protein